MLSAWVRSIALVIIVLVLSPHCQVHAQTQNHSWIKSEVSRLLAENNTPQKLKKAILRINWSDAEWMELTEVVRRNRTEAGRVHLPYVNLPSSHERPTTSSMDHTSAGGPSYPKSNGDMSRRVGMPPYENLKQESSRTTTLPYQNISGDTCQASMHNDVQRLAIRAQGKPPIPAPRSQIPSP